MWTAVSGATAQQQAVDIVANNLANSDTLGFKKDAPAFREYLATVERDHEGGDIPRGPIKDKDLWPLDGKDQSHVVVDGTYTNFRQGNMRVTQAPLDVALDGPGFLEVSTPNGIRFTRHGSLKVAMDGRLVTTEGYPVLSSQPGGLAAESQRQPASLSTLQPSQGGLATQGGVPVDAARFINLKDRGAHFTISEAGDIYAGDQLVAKLSVTEFQDNNKLRKYGEQLFENLDPNNVQTTPVRTSVHQGMLELSNVNPIEEMTKLIQANRLFEHDLKALKTYGEMIGREVNDVGKL
jgi:flagellar basal-body rod protein FlgG